MADVDLGKGVIFTVTLFKVVFVLNVQKTTFTILPLPSNTPKGSMFLCIPLLLHYSVLRAKLEIGKGKSKQEKKKKLSST